MKFFSSFDTNLKHKSIQEYREMYGEENVYVISRSKLYYYYKVWTRIAYGLLLHIGLGLAIRYSIDHNGLLYGLIVGGLFGAIFYLIAAENYIDYTMNYAIFTPHEAILTEQIGLFKRNIKSLDMHKIKSISIQKTSLFFSIFDDGILTILSEGSGDFTEIRFKYVHQPEVAKAKILHIIFEHSGRTE